MKKNELKKMDKKKMESLLIDLKRDLMKLNAQRASGTPPENPGKIRTIRRSIARILTFKKNTKGVSNQ